MYACCFVCRISLCEKGIIRYVLLFNIIMMMVFIVEIFERTLCVCSKNVTKCQVPHWWCFFCWRIHFIEYFRCVISFQTHHYVTVWMSKFESKRDRSTDRPNVSRVYWSVCFCCCSLYIYCATVHFEYVTADAAANRSMFTSFPQTHK